MTASVVLSGWTAELTSTLLSRFGLAGVSAGALLFFLSVPLWARKGAKVGSAAATAGSTVVTMTQAVALALAALLVLGVISIDMARGGALASDAVAFVRDHVDVLGRWL